MFMYEYLKVCKPAIKLMHVYADKKKLLVSIQ